MTQNKTREKTLQDKCRGMLVGLAVGDALGANIEFVNNHSKQIDDNRVKMQDGMYPKGAWTDDTSMALCLADSILENGGYDSYDVMRKYSDWVNKGHRAFDGKPAGDVGNQVRAVIDNYNNETKTIYDNQLRTDSAGNGCIMRLAPVVIATTFPNQKYMTLKDGKKTGGVIHYTESAANNEYITLEAIAPTLELARISARETHYSIVSEAGTMMFATMLYCALRGLSKGNIITYMDRWILTEPYSNVWLHNTDLFGRIFDKSGKELKDLGGYVLDAICIASWGLLHFNNFGDGMRAVIKLGGDTDTNGAIYGQLAGAYYGYESIPKDWRNELLQEKEIKALADKLLSMRHCHVVRTRFEEDKQYFREEISFTMAYETGGYDPLIVAEMIRAWNQGISDGEVKERVAKITELRAKTLEKDVAENLTFEDMVQMARELHEAFGKITRGMLQRYLHLGFSLAQQIRNELDNEYTKNTLELS